jgi:hypothetical protein
MRFALEHQQAGRQDKALWHVNMALVLDPTFVDGRRLKEQLNGKQRLYWPDRSILREAADSVIDQKLGHADLSPDGESSEMNSDQPQVIDGEGAGFETSAGADVENSFFPEGDLEPHTEPAEIVTDDEANIEAISEKQP